MSHELLIPLQIQDTKQIFYVFSANNITEKRRVSRAKSIVKYDNDSDDNDDDDDFASTPTKYGIYSMRLPRITTENSIRFLKKLISFSRDISCNYII